MREPEVIIYARNLQSGQRHSVWVGPKKMAERRMEELITNPDLEGLYTDYEIEPNTGHQVIR